jgi:hypothetical protein
MLRPLDDAKATNEDQERIRCGAGAPVAEPHRLEPLARVIGIGPRPMGPVAAWPPGGDQDR